MPKGVYDRSKAKQRELRPVADRLWERVDKDGPGGCWLWLGSAGSNGYGMMSVRLAPGEHRHALVHRISYELLVGPIPEGLTLDHLCRIRRCVNPAHLEPVTFAENVARGDSIQAVNARKTHCKRGHEFTPENTFRTTNRGRSARQCRTCRNARVNAYYWRNADRLRARQREYDRRKRAAA